VFSAGLTTFITDSDSVCEGSNPSPAAKEKDPEAIDISVVSGLLFFLVEIEQPQNPAILLNTISKKISKSSEVIRRQQT
jgi:hypothetical protein